LLYPPLQGVTFTDFHEMAFAPATIAWLLWAIDGRRWTVAYGLLAVALSIKEDQPPGLAFVGLAAIAYFARRREARGVVFGAVTVIASVAIFATYFAIVRPLAGAGGHWVPSHFYAWWGYAYGQPLPRQIAERATYLLEVFVPLAFIPLRSRAIVLAVPGLFEVLASREPLMYTMGQHYAGAWVGYVLVAFADAGARMAGELRGLRWVWTSAGLCAVVSAFFSPLHLGHFLRWPQPQDRATNALIDRIPAAASVGTYDEIYAHLGFYPAAQIGLRGTPQYVLMDERYASAAWDSQWLPVLRRDIARGVYRPAAQDDGVLLYERIH